MIKNDPLEPLSFPPVSHDWLLGGKTSCFEGFIACNESHWLSTLSNQNQSDFLEKLILSSISLEITLYVYLNSTFLFASVFCLFIYLPINF